MIVSKQRADHFLTISMLNAGGSLQGDYWEDFEHQQVLMYVVGLLEEILAPDPNGRFRFIRHYSSDLLELAGQTTDQLKRYQIWRVNGDVRLCQPLLVYSQALTPGQPASRYYRETIARRQLDLGWDCYCRANDYVDRLPHLRHHRPIMRTLIEEFFFIIQMIDLAVSEYFHIWQRLSAGELYHLLHDEDFQKANRNFFRSYYRWRHQPSAKNQKRLDRATRLLRRYTPHFQPPT